MTKEEIDIANRLIAEFMGIAYKDGQKCFDGIDAPEYYRKFLHPHKFWFSPDEIHFNSSADWLMPVLEKICRMKIGDGIKTVEYGCPRTFGMINPENGNLMVRLDGFQLVEAPTLQEAIFKAVVDFIKSLNEHSNGKS